MGLNDLVLFIVIFASIAAAILFPGPCAVFQPYLLYFMMSLLFLSFLGIDFKALRERSMGPLARLGVLVLLKLIIVPVTLYGIARLLIPPFALPILLLSGISTGVVAPFIGTLLGADVVQILRMVVVTSVLVPFSLPILVKVLAGAEISIPLTLMIRLLALVIFIPMIAVLVLRRVWPQLLDLIWARRFPVSLILFTLTNLAVFSQYSGFFFQEPGQIIVAIVVAYTLSAIYYSAGFVLTPGQALPERLAWGTSFAVMNNVLVIVFSAEFFGPLCPTLAAMYMFPFFTMIVPVKWVAQRMQPPSSPHPEQS